MGKYQLSKELTATVSGVSVVGLIVGLEPHSWYICIFIVRSGLPARRVNGGYGMNCELYKGTDGRERMET